MKVIAHHAAGHEPHATNVRYTPQDTLQSFLFQIVKEYLTTASARQDVVAIALKRPFAEDALPSARSRTRRRIRSRFCIDADKLLL